MFSYHGRSSGQSRSDAIRDSIRLSSHKLVEPGLLGYSWEMSQLYR